MIKTRTIESPYKDSKTITSITDKEDKKGYIIYKTPPKETTKTFISNKEDKINVINYKPLSDKSTKAINFDKQYKISFVDSKTSSRYKSYISQDFIPGLNLCGICYNELCQNIKQYFIQNIGKNEINLNNFDFFTFCPVCKHMTEITEIIFYEEEISKEILKELDKYNYKSFENNSFPSYTIPLLGCLNFISHFTNPYKSTFNNYKSNKNIVNLSFDFINNEKEIKNKQFLSKYNIPKEILRIKEYIGKELSLEDIENAYLGDFELQKLREKKIESLCEDTMNNKMTYIEYCNKISELSQEIKNDIIFRVFHYPKQFIEIKEIQKIADNSPNFIKRAFYKYLKQLNIITCFEKNSKKKPIIILAMLQILGCGDIYKRNITLKYNFDPKKENKIINNTYFRNNFINEKKKVFACILNTNEDDIIITDIKSGCIICKLRRKNGEITTFDLRKILSDKGISCVNDTRLVEGMYIDELFDCRGNRDTGWGIGEKRGPPGFTIDYDPPLGYHGYGLNVKDRYDNGNNDWLHFCNIPGEWCIAYHGTATTECFTGILNPLGVGIKGGVNQAYASCENDNPRNSAIIPKCGVGVYTTTKIKEAESYSSSRGYLEIKKEKYYLVFMCRVNPDKIRYSNCKPEYWILSGDPNEPRYRSKPIDEIRPYRILLKKKKDLNKESKKMTNKIKGSLMNINKKKINTTRTNKGRIKNSSYNNNIFQKIINDDDSFRSKKSSIKIQHKERTISPKISEINKQPKEEVISPKISEINEQPKENISKPNTNNESTCLIY